MKTSKAIELLEWIRDDELNYNFQKEVEALNHAIEVMTAFNHISVAWTMYQNDMRPETRNNFLRAFKKAHDDLGNIEPDKNGLTQR